MSEIADPPPGTVDWSAVPFAVCCPRCAHDLRGASDPTCPACALELDWSELIPWDALTCAACGYGLRGLRETRCPECGLAFEWDDCVARFHARKTQLFESSVRGERLRGLWRSVRSGWRPAALWRRLPLADVPHGRRLAMLAAVAVAFLMAWSLLAFALDWMRSGWSPAFRLAVGLSALDAIRPGILMCVWALAARGKSHPVQ